MTAIDFHPDVSRFAPFMKILAAFGEQTVLLYPGGGSYHVRRADDPDNTPRADLLSFNGIALETGGAGTLDCELPVRLYSSIYKGECFAEMIVEFSNSSASAPPGVLEGTFRVFVEGPGLFVVPGFALAHGVLFTPEENLTTLKLSETTLADQQEIRVHFFVGFGDGGQAAVADRILHPEAHRKDPDQCLSLDVPLVARDKEWDWDYIHLLTQSPVDPDFGYRRAANASGPDKRFGFEPYPNAYEADRIMLAELLRAEGRYPCHVDFDQHIRVPDPGAIYFDGELSWHSRNRLGRPTRDAPPEVREPFLKGRGGWEAPRAEWCESVLPILAYEGNCLWAARKCVSLGYWICNQTHEPIPINDGGYDTPYLVHLRAFHRAIITLWRCYVVMNHYGWIHHVDEFGGHLCDMCRWLVEKSKPLGYGIVPRNESEEVQGHPGEPTISSWQMLGLPVLFKIWGELSSEDAKTILMDQGTQLLETYELVDGVAWFRKVALASDPKIGWPLHPSQDGLIFWPYAGLRLISEDCAGLFTQEQKEKAFLIVKDLERRWEALTGAEWEVNVSTWGCGMYH